MPVTVPRALRHAAVAAGVVAFCIALPAPSPVAADHWFGPTGGWFSCETLQGPGGGNATDNWDWTWHYFDVEPELAAALNTARQNIYEPTDLLVSEVSFTGTTDMVAIDGDLTTQCGEIWDLPGQELWALTVCAGVNSAGECEQHHIWFDAPDVFNMTPSQRVGLACHELGHGVGLDHREFGNDARFTGCMPVGGPYLDHLSDHDRATIDFSYPPDGRAYGYLIPNVDANPDLTKRTNNRLDVVLRGADGNVYWYPYSGAAWLPAVYLNGASIGGPSVVSWDGNRLDVFIRGLDNGLWHRSNTGSGWSAWQNLGGILTSSPDVASWGGNRLDVFARGANNAMWHRAWNGAGWLPWEQLGGTFVGGPGAASGAANRIDVAAVGTDSALWSMRWTGSSWTSWQRIGGVFTGDPDVAAFGSSRLDVIGESTDDNLWHVYRSGSTWGALENLGGRPMGGAGLTWRTSTKLDVVTAGHDFGLWYTYWNGSSW